MTFQTLDYIIAIAEERSISRAADRLLISQPALSRQLKRLEDQLDAKLFVREHNEMRLTDAGKIYVNGARSIQNIHEHALEDIHKLSQSGRARSPSSITTFCCQTFPWIFSRNSENSIPTP